MNSLKLNSYSQFHEATITIHWNGISPGDTKKRAEQQGRELADVLTGTLSEDVWIACCNELIKARDAEGHG